VTEGNNSSSDVAVPEEATEEVPAPPCPAPPPAPPWELLLRGEGGGIAMTAVAAGDGEGASIDVRRSCDRNCWLHTSPPPPPSLRPVDMPAPAPAPAPPMIPSSSALEWPPLLSALRIPPELAGALLLGPKYSSKLSE
jgi:hypothetical protein